MRKLLTLVFCICVIFAAAGVSEVRSVTPVHSEVQAGDPFRKLAGWIKRLFVKQKPPYCPAAQVEELTLDKTELIASSDDGLIKVTTLANDPEENTLIYMYKVSGGKVLGEGAAVVWDLSNVGPGQYSIVAGVDDGCGECGRTQTRTVRVMTNSVSK